MNEHRVRWIEVLEAREHVEHLVHPHTTSLYPQKPLEVGRSDHREQTRLPLSSQSSQD